MLYNLKIDKYRKLEIRPLRNAFSRVNNEINEYPMYINDLYYGCSEKTPLLELGSKIKNEWIEEKENQIADIEKKLAEAKNELSILKSITVKSIGC